MDQAENALNRLEKDAAWLKDNKFKDYILLCFKTDPYPQEYECHTITREAIKILDENGLKYVILTGNDKIGRAIEDFEQLKRPENIKLVIKIESIPRDRKSIRKSYKNFMDLFFTPLDGAFKKGINIWIDLNPAIYPRLSRELIHKFYPIVNQWNVGDDEFEPKTESKSTWEKFEEDAKEFFKTLEILSPWTEGDIPVRKGNCNILLIAPHGHKNTDENTYEIARHMADELDCYAVVSELYQKPPYKRDKRGRLIKNKITGNPVRHEANKKKKWVDLNNLDEVNEQLDKEEFLGPIKGLKDEIVKRFEAAQIFLTHGIKDKHINYESEIINAAPELGALIGIGRGNPNEEPPYEERLSASSETAVNLIELLHSDIIAAEALPRRNRRSYAGWDRRNLNQLFTERNDNDTDVQSVQIEIKWTGYRETANIQNTAGIFAEAFAKMDSFKAMEILPISTVEPVSDIDLVDRAYEKLSEIFYSNVGNAIYEAGKFIVKEFYSDEIELVKSHSPVKELSLNQLIKKIQGSSHKQPSRSWIFNAVKLYAETKELGITVQTYGQLPVSHKILLFSVHNRDKKIQLIRETAENKYTVVALKNRIAELMVAEKPKIEAPKSLLQVVKNPDLLFSDDYALSRDVKSLSKLKPAELEKIHTRITEKLERIEKELNEFQTAMENHKGHLKQYKHFIKSVETAKNKIQK